MDIPAAPAARRVLRVALASRLVISLVALLTALLVEPYDTSGRLLSPSLPPLAALANWDGVYFAHVASHGGYDYEHFHAFFPLYPLVVRLVSSLLLLFLPISDASVAVPLAGWLVSNASFVLAALYLYRLGGRVLRDEPTARRAAYLFCIAPSSIFMSAIYSESLMCLLSFAGMVHVESYRIRRRFRSLLVAAVCFGGASATRSNGVLLSLYIAWSRLLDSPAPLQTPRRFLVHWLATALLGFIAIGPQIWYFVQAIRVYCPVLVRSLAPFAAVETLLQEDRPWCATAIPNVSAMYMFIQREYWNVGFLRYYEWRQLPNFVLAAPILVLSVYSLARFFVSAPSRSSAVLRSKAVAAPYFVHWGFLLLNALAVVHIQVTTRLLAACPPLFWAPAAFFFTGAPSTKSSRSSVVSMQGRLVVAYFLVFCVLGAGLFTSFYPWT